jgi:hypothetical protein
MASFFLNPLKTVSSIRINFIESHLYVLNQHEAT